MKIQKYPELFIRMLNQIKNADLSKENITCRCGPINIIINQYSEVVREKYPFHNTTFLHFIIMCIKSPYEDGRYCSAVEKQSIAISLLDGSWTKNNLFIDIAIKTGIINLDNDELSLLSKLASLSKLEETLKFNV